MKEEGSTENNLGDIQEVVADILRRYLGDRETDRDLIVGACHAATSFENLLEILGAHYGQLDRNNPRSKNLLALVGKTLVQCTLRQGQLKHLLHLYVVGVNINSEDITKISLKYSEFHKQLRNLIKQINGSGSIFGDSLFGHKASKLNVDRVNEAIDRLIKTSNQDPSCLANEIDRQMVILLILRILWPKIKSRPVKRHLESKIGDECTGSSPNYIKLLFYKPVAMYQAIHNLINSDIGVEFILGLRPGLDERILQLMKECHLEEDPFSYQKLAVIIDDLMPYKESGGKRQEELSACITDCLDATNHQKLSSVLQDHIDRLRSGQFNHSRNLVKCLHQAQQYLIHDCKQEGTDDQASQQSHRTHIEVQQFSEATHDSRHGPDEESKSHSPAKQRNDDPQPIDNLDRLKNCISDINTDIEQDKKKTRSRKKLILLSQFSDLLLSLQKELGSSNVPIPDKSPIIGVLCDFLTKYATHIREGSLDEATLDVMLAGIQRQLEGYSDIPKLKEFLDNWILGLFKLLPLMNEFTVAILFLKSGRFSRLELITNNLLMKWGAGGEGDGLPYHELCSALHAHYAYRINHYVELNKSSIDMAEVKRFLENECNADELDSAIKACLTKWVHCIAANGDLSSSQSPAKLFREAPIQAGDNVSLVSWASSANGVRF